MTTTTVSPPPSVLDQIPILNVLCNHFNCKV